MKRACSRALFLDRDGVINYDDGYTSKIDQFHFVEGIFELCRAANELGYLIIVITNQAGIGRGYYTEEEFLLLTEWMSERFKENGVIIADVFYCPTHPESVISFYKMDSFDRKPNPGMFLKAAEKYEISMEDSIMIGDKDSDMLAAMRGGVGVRCMYSPVDQSSNILSKSATHSINSLITGIKLLSVNKEWLSRLSTLDGGAD